jgi:glycosyltransferase involved in cell wall biosynthesis
MKKFSIIIPVKPGGEVRALEALRRVDYPEDAFEVLVAEGTCPSLQRNLAAEAAQGDILYFLDDDSLVAPGFLRRATTCFEADAVAAVGGPSLTPDGDTPLQQAFGLALASPFGGGSVRNRYQRSGSLRETGDHELILCNLGISAAAFREAGGFDRRLYPNEENELLARMKRKGLTLFHDPELSILRSQRSSFRAFIRQLFGYGRGRAQQILLGGGSGFTNLVPPAFFLYILSLPFLDKPVYYLPLLCYLGIGLSFAIAAGFNTEKTVPALLLPVVFPALHLSYGAGLLWGLITWGARKRTRPTGEVFIRRVKEFDGCREW